MTLMFLLSMTCTLLCSIRLQRNAAPMLPKLNQLIHTQAPREKESERGTFTYLRVCMYVHCMYMGIQMLRLCGGSGAAAIGPPTLWLRASFAVSVAAASTCCCCCCRRSEVACLPRARQLFQRRTVVPSRESCGEIQKKHNIMEIQKSLAQLDT